MASMALLETLEDIFKTRGYEILRSSGENHFLLLEKEGSRMAVGYSPPGHKVTEGEADMFISMARMDPSVSMLFISPGKLQKAVKKSFEKEGVATWNRTALAISIGEHFLMKDEGSKTRNGDRKNVMDLFNTDDVDPVDELRAYHRQIHEEEIGGFKVHDVNLGAPVSSDAWEEVISPGPEPEADPAPEEVLPLMDMPMMSVPEPEEGEGNAGSEDPLDLDGDKGEKKKSKAPSNVPEEILMNPWDGFDEWSSTSGTKKKEGPKKKKGKKADNPWLGSVQLPLKYTRKKAAAVANAGSDVELEKRYLPFFLIKASYQLEARDTDEVLDKEGNYLYNSISTKVTDVPPSLFDEIGSTKEIWDGSSPPKVLSDPRKDYNSALLTLRKRLSTEDLAVDRLVRETLMATIYSEIRYGLKKGSFKMISSRRLMVPFWIKRGDNGDPEWMVDGYLGRFVTQEETSPGV
ncbi:MAG: hypothetical protein U9R75_09340 [Candidatus Thermoplasmatota archaeon]|nr:hypothetical protein [Candidatus Thermoplasmatota archaeon]